MRRSALSPRQLQVLHLAAEGLTDKEIGHQLGLSLGTLRTYWDRMRKFQGSRSRSEVIARAIREEFHEMRSEYKTQRYLLSSMPLFVWTADPSGHVDFWSDWFLTYGGLRDSEIEGKGCSALMIEEEMGASRERWRKAQATSEGYEAVVKFRCAADQTLRWHLIHLFPLLGDEGDVVKWCGCAREIAPALGTESAQTPTLEIASRMDQPLVTLR